MTLRQGTWDTHDLVRRLCDALDTAKRVVERLASAGYADPDELTNNVRPEKVISETGLFLLAASATKHVDVRNRIDCVARLLTPYARSERMLLGVCLQPALALDYAQAHICLTSLGHPDPRFDALLRQAVGSQAFLGRERPPHRVLEQRWFTEVWHQFDAGLSNGTRSPAVKSALNQPMDLLSSSREDIYAFTHALMYATGFNFSPRRLPRSRKTILAEAEALLGRCLDEQDYDLGGELLLAWPLTGNSWSAAAAFAFRVLARVEDLAGFLPSFSTRLERLDKLLNEERTNYLLATAYHTIYVMGMLCAAALQPGRTPPKSIPIRGAASGSAVRMLQYLDAEGQIPHWREELNKLTEPETDAIASFLLDLAVRRQIVRRDFGTLRKLLELAYTSNLANTPTSSQAAEMLARLATFTSTRQVREAIESPCFGKASSGKDTQA